MKKLIFLVILINFMNQSCKHAVDNKVDILVQEKDTVKNILNPDLIDFLYHYAKEINWGFTDEWVYCNLFFFKRAEETYFTIWTFVIYPDVNNFKGEIANNCSLCLHEVKGHKVVFIFDPNDDFEGVFSVTQDCIQKGILESERENMSDIYDGDLYKRTYKISKEESGIDFIIQDSLEMPYKQ